MTAQLLLPGVDGQHRVDGHLAHRQIHKSLCLHQQTEAQEDAAHYHPLDSIHLSNNVFRGRIIVCPSPFP